MSRVLRSTVRSLVVPFVATLMSIPACDAQVDVARVCSPHVREVCYDGPSETKGVGRCRSGIHSCREDGSGFEPCEGAVLPAPEVCGGGGDENCNGKIDECTGDVLWAKRWYGGGYPRSMSTDGLGNVIIGVEYTGNLDLGSSVGLIESTSEYGASAIVKVNSAGDAEFARVVDGGAWRQLVAADKAGNIAATGTFQVPITLDGETFVPNVTQDILFFGVDPAGNVKFAKQFFAQDDCVAEDIDSSPQGDIVLGGDCYLGSLDLGGGASVSGSFVARFADSGEFIYAKEFSAVNISSSAFDGQGNIVLAGWFYDQANFGGQTLESPDKDSSFIVKLGPAGEHLWSKQIGAKDAEYVYIDVKPDHTGNVYVAATFQGTIDFGDGSITSSSPPHTGDAFLMKLDPKGNYLWGKHFGNGEGQALHSLTVDASGNVIVSASFSGKIDFGAGTLYAASMSASDLAVAKFAPNGDAVWSRRFGMGNAIYAPVITTGALGEVFFSGIVVGDIDFGTGALVEKSYAEDMFVVKLAP